MPEWILVEKQEANKHGPSLNEFMEQTGLT